MLQSVMRGGDRFSVFYSYNPPKSRDSWVNKEALRNVTGRLVHDSCYLDVDPAWNGPTFCAEAEELKTSNPRAYAHEYLGEVTGTGGAVFENLELRSITDEEIAEFDRITNGVDWGYFPDPWAFVRCHYDSARRTLYIFDAASTVRQGNDATAAIVLEKLAGEQQQVICDSAEPKSVSDYKRLNIAAIAAKKGPGSVEYGMKWLQALQAIVIDPVRAPGPAAEFSEYEYERNREGEFCSGFPDHDNHFIDATRYSQMFNVGRGTWSDAEQRSLLGLAPREEKTA